MRAHNCAQHRSRGSRSLRAAMAKNFTLENGARANQQLDADTFFGSAAPQSSFYASCILQSDAALSRAALGLLPFGAPGVR